MNLHIAMEKIAHMFLQCIGAALMFATIWFVETRFFPVVEDFKVEYVRKTDNGYVAGGTLNKARACEFIGLTLYGTQDGKPKILLTQYKRDVFGAEVGQGHQTWGPWSVQFPPNLLEMDKLEIMGTHKCHAFWVQTTVYSKIDMKTLRAL